MKKEWLVKTLALVIVVLFICMNVNPSLAVDNVKKTSITSNQNTMNFVSSTDNFLKDIPIDCYPLESIYNSDEKFFHNTTWYMFMRYGFEGTGFYALYPNNTYRFREWAGMGFFSGGTWTNDGRYLCCMYENGTLYDINPETFDACLIGNGGNNLNALAYDRNTNTLWGAGDTNLFEIDIESGEQTVVAPFTGNGGNTIIGMAFDSEGILYGWDVKFSGSSYLYTIDTTTAECTQMFSIGKTLCYAQDGDFDTTDSDALWLAAYIISPEYGGYLLKIDKNTGEILYQGVIQGSGEIDAFAISYDCSPPVTTISFNPSEPDGCNGWYVSNVTVTLNATDEYYGVKATYYKIKNGEWQTYESPFIISDDGDDILIEYYSIDNAGYVENVKNSTLDIDKTPPETSLEYNAWKQDCKWYVKFIFNVTDLTSGSGGRVEWFLNDEIQKIDEGPGPTYEWTIEWSQDYAHSSVIFKATTWDKAGNQANESIKGSDIKSHPRSQLVNTYQSSNMLFWEILGIRILQKLLVWMVSGVV
jgi:hypothetical protein